MGIILISKYTKEEEIATDNATMKTNPVESSFTNYQQQNEMLSEPEHVKGKAAEIIY
ncbi:hypothetical protein [Pontibacter aydingkolensis]